MSLEAGSRLGPYEITGKLGEGGMGEVYRATDSKLKREVAIKVLPEAFAADAERLARFEREAQLLAQLHHPYIASIFGLEESGETRALVMELVEGPTLDERMASGDLSVEEVLSIARQIAEALEEAHGKGIVHRDLKPQNVKLTPDGQVKVLDFGLAKAMDPALGSNSVADLARSPTLLNSPTLTAVHGTQLGVILGTAAYMAPEQARGSAVDKRADIWAFGVVVYEMLTGTTLFSGESVSDTLAAVLRADIDLDRLPLATPTELRRLLRHCLERNPKNRLHDIADARIVIEDLVAGRMDLDAAPSAAGDIAASGLGSRRWLLLGVCTLLLVLGGYALGRLTSSSGMAPAAVRPRPVAMHYEQVSDTVGIESEPSLSPDGKNVVFSRQRDGRSEIMIQRVGARVPSALTAEGDFDDRQPAFSPDGDRIAFRSNRGGGGVFLMDTSGESVRRLSDFGFHPTWSPDGGEVALALGGFYYPTDRAGSTSGLWAVDVSSLEKREISHTGDMVQPSWSPHGHRIAYWGLRHNTGQRDVFTVAADGSEVSTAGVGVTDDAHLDWSPAWSPDGRLLYFVSNRGGSMNLWRVAIEEESGKTLGVPEPVTTPSHWIGVISFSQDGKRLAYGSLDWRTTLMRARLDVANGRLAGPPTSVIEGTQPIRDHQLSPDGQWIAFNRVSPQEDLFVVRIDGSRSRRLTDDSFRDRSPTWSPDGQRIAFYSDRSGSYQLWLINPDGSGLERVTAVSEGTVAMPTWSPDGQRIAYTSLPGGGRMVDLSAGDFPVKPEALPQISEHDSFWPFSWSPDGRRIAGLEMGENGEMGRVAIYDIAERTYAFEILSGGPNWLFPVWLNDSRRLIVRDERGIWLVDPGHGEPPRLVEVGGYSTGVSVGVSRDDRWLTWTETGTQGDIWIAELE